MRSVTDANNRIQRCALLYPVQAYKVYAKPICLQRPPEIGKVCVLGCLQLLLLLTIHNTRDIERHVRAKLKPDSKRNGPKMGKLS